MAAYSLAPGYNNVAGLIPVSQVVDGKAPRSHPSGAGTYEAAREFVNFDGVSEDDSYDRFEWEFAALLPTDIKEIETDILNGARSGPVTVETKDRYHEWIQLNAVLTIPALLPLQGEKIGTITFTFTLGEVIP